MLTKLKQYFDLRDAFVFGGIACIWYGLNCVYPPSAWIVVGVVFLYLGVRN